MERPMDGARANRIFRIILCAYIVWGGIYIYRTSFVVSGVRYFSLFDDAMVSMRYASNFVHGYGLVYNPGGERIEGFTNPLWVAYMAVLHLLPIAISKISLLIQLTGLALMCCNLFFVRRIAREIWNSDEIALGAVLLTAFYLPLNLWALEGMEVSLLTAILSYCVLRQLEASKFQKIDWIGLVLLAASTLVRLDMAFTFIGLISFLALTNPQTSRRLIAGSIVLLLIFVGAQSWLRYSYYGDLLPNTYYLKMTGISLVTSLFFSC